MKIKRAKFPGNTIVEINDLDCEKLSKPADSQFGLKKILVPIDLSDRSQKTLQYAIPFAKQFNAEIIFLYVMPKCYAIGHEYDPDFELLPGVDSQTDAVRKLKTLAKGLVPLKIPVQIETCNGAEVLEIVNGAKRLKVDLIVISTHGRTGRAHAFAGSVAENIVQLAPCPVLVVREHEHEFIQAQPNLPASRVACAPAL